MSDPITVVAETLHANCPLERNDDILCAVAHHLHAERVVAALRDAGMLAEPKVTPGQAFDQWRSQFHEPAGLNRHAEEGICWCGRWPGQHDLSDYPTKPGDADA